MIIEKVVSGPFATNAYLVCENKGGNAFLIDPAPDCFSKVETLIDQHKVTLKAIYLTHSHYDHIADAHLFIKRYNVPLYVHENDAKNVEEPGSDGVPLFMSVTGAKPTGYFKDGEERKVGSLVFLVIETPGHTPGGVVFYFKGEKILFSGDTLFKGTCGRTDFSTGDKEQMSVSLHKLVQLPGDVKVYPGHGDATTISQEKEWICP